MDYPLLKKYTRNINVLFVEDDIYFRKEFSELLQDIFPKVATAEDGLDALNKYNEYYEQTSKYYDLIISDIKMPNCDGVELVDALYQINKEQLVIILSARNEFNYLLPLVNLGIHQFFTKPIDYTTFLDDMLKLCSQIYHNNLNKDDSIVQITESLHWNKSKLQLIEEEKIIDLTKNEIRFVEAMLSKNGQICTVDSLLNTIWFDDFDIDADVSNLKSLIYRLRKKVPDLHIKNIYGMGYIHDSQ